MYVNQMKTKKHNRTMHQIGCLLVLLGLISCGQTPAPAFYEVVIKGGTVYTGSDSEPKKVDIGINADTIAHIGKIDASWAGQVIDARDLVVTPGFIDMHVHLDPIFKYPDAKSLVSQGVTTALGGPDGGGPWPFEKYLDSLDREDLGMNVAYLVGHNRIRRSVMQMEDRAPTPEELEQMEQLVQEAMDAGAFGISTGLKYLPGAFSQMEEVIRLSSVAANSGGIYTSHLREEGLGLLEGVEEAIQIGEKADIPVVLTHHKVVGMPSWGDSKRTLAMVDSARAQGIDVMLDQYPYDASFTSISILIPAWSRAGGQRAFIERTKDPVLKDSILRGITFNILNDRGGGGLERVQLARTPWDSSLSGKTLKFWAERQGLEPTLENGAQLVMQAQLEGGGSAIFHAMDEKDLQRIMKHPMTMIGSDARLTEPGDSWPHPRYYGTYPRVLGHYVRDMEIIDLGQAIQKMTALPAQRLGLEKRGQLKVGHYADITIFDRQTIIDKATFLEPHQYSQGIVHVFVNGVLTLENSDFTPDRGGLVLRASDLDKDNP